MKTFRVTYHLGSATATPFQADTIFGHLCWALKYLEGEEALTDFLEWYRIGEPLLLVSNGFPGDLLPRPLVPRRHAAAGTTVAERIEAFGKRKETRKAELVPMQEFNRLLDGEEVAVRAPAAMPRTRSTLKNQINRLTGTTGEAGRLYPFEETYWRGAEPDGPVDIPVSIYCRAQEGFETKAEQLFRFVAEQGYGKRKSVGYGQIRSMAFEPFDGFEGPADANGFVTLSNFVPAAGDPTDGYWKGMVKYGKLGEAFEASEDNPFKRPLVMLAAGSVFRVRQPREYYGRLVDGISHLPEVVQYGLAFPVPLRIGQGHA